VWTGLGWRAALVEGLAGAGPGVALGVLLGEALGAWTGRALAGPELQAAMARVATASAAIAGR
jgi:hypothetical protein